MLVAPGGWGTLGRYLSSIQHVLDVDLILDSVQGSLRVQVKVGSSLCGVAPSVSLDGLLVDLEVVFVVENRAHVIGLNLCFVPLLEFSQDYGAIEVEWLLVR